MNKTNQNFVRKMCFIHNRFSSIHFVISRLIAVHENFQTCGGHRYYTDLPQRTKPCPCSEPTDLSA